VTTASSSVGLDRDGGDLGTLTDHHDRRHLGLWKIEHRMKDYFILLYLW
jgi:hypothetical protein